LAITPILEGQTSTEKNTIPPHQQTAPPTQENQFTPNLLTTSQPQPPTQDPDLIDFGENDRPASQQPLLPTDPRAAQTQNSGQQQRDLDNTLRSTSTPPHPNKGPLIDFHADLNKELPGVHKITRQDTNTQEIDEFVDAQG
jgi:hypothetical protein